MDREHSEGLIKSPSPWQDVGQGAVALTLPQFDATRKSIILGKVEDCTLEGRLCWDMGRGWGAG